jgi:hypothetical protein
MHQLTPRVKAGMDALDQQLSQQLAAYDSILFTDLYYLPGRQLTPASLGVITGNTNQDVTIVLEI